MPYQNKEDSIILQTRSTNITIQAYTRLVFGGLQLLNAGTVYKLQNLNFSLVIQFDPTTSKRSWGFKPIIKDVQIDLTRMYFIMDNVIQPLQAGINLFVDILTPIIVKQTKKIILKVASPALGVLSQNQRLQIAQQYGAYMYQFQITFTQPPSIVYEQTTYMNLQLDIQIENVYTGNVCPIFDTGSLPNRVNSNQALELLFSDIIIDQLLWVLIDSKSQIQLLMIPCIKILISQFYQLFMNLQVHQLLVERKITSLTLVRHMDQIKESIYVWIFTLLINYIYGQTAQQQMYIRKKELYSNLNIEILNSKQITIYLYMEL